MKKERDVKLRKVKNKTAQKKRAWTSFSLYIRLRDCLATTGKKDFGVCVTCGDRRHFKELQAGHAISGRSNAILLDEELVNAQCLTEESSLLLANGEKKSIADIKVGDKLLAFNKKTFKKEIATVEHCSSFIPQKLYEVELEDGSKFWATGDHRVVVNGKFKEIKDMLHDMSAHNIMEL